MAVAAGGLPSNMALGTTCEDQKRADINVRALLDAARDLRPVLTFVSAEPLLGPIDFTRIDYGTVAGVTVIRDALADTDIERIDWVITGGETDQGQHRARPSHPDWYRTIRDACASAGVPYLHKQNGEWLPAGDWYADHPVSLALRAWDGARWVEPMTDRAEYVARIGKRAAGRLLDDVEHNGIPKAIT